jgi:hypothetical protein
MVRILGPWSHVANLAVRKSLAVKVATKLNDSAVTGTGSLEFVIPSFANSQADPSALFQVVGTLGSLSANVEFSMDGGTTWNILSSAALVAATPFKLITPIVAGPIWRLNITAGPTSADFYVSVN